MGSLLGFDSLEDVGLVAGEVVVLAVWVVLVDIIVGRRFAIGRVRREVVGWREVFGDTRSER